MVILHGRGDRWVPARLSADFSVRARRSGARVARFTVAGGHSMLRHAHRWHTFTRDVVLAGTGLEPMRRDVAAALHQPSPDVLAVPLNAPWAASKETVDFVRAVGAREGLLIHDALLAPPGRATYAGHVRTLGGLTVRETEGTTPLTF